MSGEAPATPSARAFNRAHRRAPSRATAAASNGCCATSARRCWSRSLTLVATIWLYVVMPKGFLPLAGHRPDHRRDRRPGRRSRSPRCSGCRRRSPTRCASDPDVDRRRLGGRRRARSTRRRTPAASTITLKPRDERDACVADDRRPAASARSRAHPRHDRLLPAGAGRPDRHARQPRAVPVHAGRHATPPRSPSGRTSSPRELRSDAGAARGRLRGAGRRPARHASTSTARRPAGSASRCRPSTTRSTTPSASARSRPSTRQANQYRVILEAHAAVPAAIPRARPALRAGVDGAQCR